MRAVQTNQPWLIGGILITLALAGGLGLAVSSQHQRTIILNHLPPAPVFSSRVAGLKARVASAEGSARSYWRPGTGLAELSRLYQANGFYNEALQCLAGLQQLERAEARWPHLQAAMLGEFGQLDEALPAQQRAVLLAPSYGPARLRLGDMLLKTNQTVAANLAYAEVLRREPANPYALLGLAKSAVGQGNWVEAGAWLQQARDAHPDFIGGLSLLVTVREHLNDQAGADALRAMIGKREFTELADPWRDALTDDCYDPYLLSVAAAKANFSGEGKTARRWLEQAMALAPTDHAYRRQLGKLLLETREFGPAQWQLEKAVALAPDDSEAWSLLILLFNAQGNRAAAERALASGLVYCPSSAALRYTNGQRLSQAGPYPEAISELQMARRLRPNEANASIDLALIYFRQERLAEAVAELKTALTVQPGHPLALGTLARYAIGTADEPAARHWIRQLRLQPRVPLADLNQITAEYQQLFKRAPW